MSKHDHLSQHSREQHHHLCPTRVSGYTIQCVCDFIKQVERHYEHGCELAKCRAIT